MKVQIFTAEDDYDFRNGLIIKVDGKIVFSAFDGEPEDNNLSRNFNDCYIIGILMEQAWSVGADKEEFEVETVKVTWDELFEIY